MSPLSNLTAYTSILENSAATPGLFDARFNTVHANILAVDTTVSQVSSALSGSGLSGLRDVTLTRYGGALGDGSTDDRAAFLTGATSTQTQAILYAPSSASVYRIASASNITGAYQPIPGAVLRPTSATTIRMSGPILAGSYQILDTSLGGGADFTANRSIHYHDARWYGVTGDGTTDDQPALTRMVASVPDYSTIQFPSNMVMKLGSTWTISARKGMRFVCLGSPFPDGSNAAQFKWQGGAGGTMMALASCDHAEVQGFFFNMGPSSSQYATVGIDLDQTGVNGVTGTSSLIINNLFNVSLTSSTSYSIIRIGQTATGNQEYHRIMFNGLHGSGFPFTKNNGISATISGGALGVATINSLPSPLTIGRAYRFRCAGAGVGGVVLDTTLTATTTTSGTLTVAASQGVTGAICIVGESYGWGVHIGGSLSGQAKGIYLQGNDFIGFARGIYLENGSLIAFKNNFNGNEADLYLENANEPCEVHYCNTEQSRQHAVLTANYAAPISFRNNRWGNLCAAPSTGWLQFNNHSQAIEVAECSFDDVPAAGTGSTAYDFVTGWAGAFRASMNGYGGGLWTPEQVGYTTLDALSNKVYPKQLAYHVESIGEQGITGWPRHWVSGELSEHRGADTAGVAIFEVFSTGGVIPKHVGLVGRARAVHGGNNADVLVGIQGTVVKDFGGGGLVPWVQKSHMIEAVLPAVNTEGFTPSELHGFHVVAPVLSGGGGGVPIRGIVIEDLQLGGGATTPTNTFAIVQSGISDPNQFNGPSYHTSGLSILPTLAFSSESSLGFYRSGAATIAPSLGTLNLATNAVRLSMRTLAASAVTASAALTNVAVNEVVLIVGGASGASFGFMSGGTFYGFNSAFSAKAT